ncbi:hypothetical protein [Arthrobacter sp. PAMC 25486]|uniref:hypothetical protein n=1 Tax=Arthrobacter sp. PAMC 25486 TaxID=1494608 RepID=UPI0026AA298F
MKAHFRFVATALLVPLLALAACAQTDPGNPPDAVPGSQPATASPTVPPGTAPSATGTAPAAGIIDLSITLTESPGAEPHQFRLVADVPDPADAPTLTESSLPDPAAALAAVASHGEKMFFPVPDPTRVCTQQYGGPEIAVVTGWFKGKEVNATFNRTDGCEIARWRTMAPLFGALAGGTGAI